MLVDMPRGRSVLLAGGFVLAACGSNDGPSAGPLREDGGGVDAGSAACVPNEDPLAPADLKGWLERRTYRCWPHESRVHVSVGFHNGNVQVYFSPTLDKAFAESGEHPIGVATVKELYAAGDTTTVMGWDVALKTASTGGGEGWYWFELFGTTRIEGAGIAQCASCHDSGKDYVLTTHPLR
jgi:hypothetical protein